MNKGFFVVDALTISPFWIWILPPLILKVYFSTLELLFTSR